MTQIEQEQKSARRVGTVCVFLSAVLYSIGGLCIKLIPWSGIAINGARTAIALVIIGLYLAVTRHRPRINMWVLLGAVSVCGTNTLYTIANKLTTAANTIVLQFTAPIFVILFSALFLKKRPRRLDLWVCAIVLGGVVLFFVDGLSVGGTLGNILALLSGVSYAGVFMLGDLPDGDPISSVFWGDVISAAIGLPFLLTQPPLDAGPLVALVVLGAFQVGVAYILLTVGLKTTPSVTACLISGIEPVLNPILVAVFYHETVGPLSLLGAVVVLGAIITYNVIKAGQTDSIGV